MERVLVGWEALTDDQRQRWTTVLEHVVTALPARAGTVVVDGNDAAGVLVADALAATLRDRGRPCTRLTADAKAATDAAKAANAKAADPKADAGGGPTQGREARPPGILIADGRTRREQPPAGHWDVVLWVRTPKAERRADDADIVIDLHDPAWPVIRHIGPRLAGGEYWYRSESQAFFAARAAGWDTKFGDDLPAYAAAVAEARLTAGMTAVDLGCGTGRALPVLRSAIGSAGRLLGIDLTPQMLTAARPRARSCDAGLLLADARHLPLRTGSVDAVFAAGLLSHLPDARAGLAELARITRTGGTLVLFHPTGRAALAARHGRTLHPDEPLAEAVLRAGSAAAGWQLTSYDDGPGRFCAVAVRQDHRPR